MSLKYAQLMDWLDEKESRAQSDYSLESIGALGKIVNAAMDTTSENRVAHERGVRNLKAALEDSPEVQKYLESELNRALEDQAQEI